MLIDKLEFTSIEKMFSNSFYVFFISILSDAFIQFRVVSREEKLLWCPKFYNNVTLFACTKLWVLNIDWLLPN